MVYKNYWTLVHKETEILPLLVHKIIQIIITERSVWPHKLSYLLLTSEENFKKAKRSIVREWVCELWTYPNYQEAELKKFYSMWSMMPLELTIINFRLRRNSKNLLNSWVWLGRVWCRCSHFCLCKYIMYDGIFLFD